MSLPKAVAQPRGGYGWATNPSLREGWEDIMYVFTNI